MAKSVDYVPVRLTRRYREAQDNEKFRSWLTMQSSVMEIVFPIHDVPALRGTMFTEEGLQIAESELLARFDDEASAYSDDNLTLAMRFVYFIGETFRRHFEGEWVAVPRDESRGGGALQAVDVPFREGFVDPLDLMGIALVRRSGKEISRVFGYAKRDHNKWIVDGRPERVFRGTLREPESSA